MYKDLKATAILLCIIGFLFGTWAIGKYTSMETKEHIVLGLALLAAAVLLFAIWKVIRIMID